MADLSGQLTYLIKVTVERANDLPKADVTSDSDPFVAIHFEGSLSEPKQRKTRVIEDELNPVWDEMHYFLGTENTKMAHIEVWDKDEITANEKLGSVSMDASLWNGENHTLELQKNGQKAGKISLSITKIKVDSLESVRQLLKSNQEKIDVTTLGIHNPVLYCYVHIHRAFNVKSSDRSGYSDPYVLIEKPDARNRTDNNHEVFPEKQTTSVIEKCLNPIWEEGLAFLIHKAQYLKLVLKDFDIVSIDDILGETTIPICEKSSMTQLLDTQGRVQITIISMPCRALL